MKKVFNFRKFEEVLYDNNMNASKFCKVSKIPSATVSKWHDVENVRKLEHIKKIENILNVKYEDLCDEIEEKKKEKVSEYINIGVCETKFPPVIMSSDSWIWNNSGDDEDEKDRKTYGTEYGVLVIDDSMEPKFLRGGVLSVSKIANVANNDYAIIFYLGDNGRHVTAFRRVNYIGEKVILSSENKNLQTVQINRIQVIGIHRVTGYFIRL